MDARSRIAARPDVMLAAAARIVAKGGTPDGVNLAWIITSCRLPMGLAIILRMAVPVRQTPAIASP